MTSGRFATASRLTACTLLVLGIAAASVVGCAPEPEPTPTPAFASEEDAFAAAEEVYRAYNDALNARRDGDPNSDAREYLTGLALEGDADTSGYLKQNGLTLVGHGVVVEFEGESATPSTEMIKIFARVCLDVSVTRLLDQGGNDVTPDDRPPRVPLRVAFIRPDERLLISESSLIEGESCDSE